MTDRERLHALVEDLPEAEVDAALRFVESLHLDREDPVARALSSAPPDDEPLTPEDLVQLEAAELDWQAGRTVPHEEARRRLLREP